MYRYLLPLLLLIASCTAEQKDFSGDASYLRDAQKKLTDNIVHDIFSPPVASRIYVYASIAAYEAAIQGDETYLSLAGQLNQLSPIPDPEEAEKVDRKLASLFAYVRVGQALTFSEHELESYRENLLQTLKKEGVSPAIIEASLAHGEVVAKHILTWAAADNYAQTRSFQKYTVTNEPGTWVPTPPAYMEGIEPHWTKLRPFGLDSSTQFVPAPPTAYSTDKNSQFYKEALEVHEIIKNSTEEQREIAAFWDCNPFVMNVVGHVMFATKKITPGGHWMEIATTVAKDADLDWLATAEVMAVTSIHLADAFISCWDEKYRSVLVRPETYINQHIDEEWLPLLQTPPFPEYTSGHSVASGSASIALTKLFGDNVAFIDSTEVAYGLPVRSFTSFHQAAEEAAISRFYAGIHYMPAINEGLKQGREVGSFLAEKVRTRRAEGIAKKE